VVLAKPTPKKQPHNKGPAPKKGAPKKGQAKKNPKNKKNGKKPQYDVSLAALKKLFALFIKEFKIAFKNKADRQHRFLLFSQNVKHINAENLKDLKHHLKIGPNAHLDYNEFVKTRTGGTTAPGPGPKRSVEARFSALEIAQAPVSMDWRAAGKVGRVRDQKSCGCCWAFASAGVLESHWGIKHGRVPSLSPQHLIDCAKATCHGCGGGDQICSYNFVSKNKGLHTEKAYKYKAKKSKCRRSTRSIGARVTVVAPLNLPYTWVGATEAEVRTFVGTVGPVTAGVCATQAWQHYGGNVITASQCACGLNHFVQIVGYGTFNGEDVWIVKNSWGTGWGVRGYAYVARAGNTCSILSQVVAPNVV